MKIEVQNTKKSDLRELTDQELEWVSGGDNGRRDSAAAADPNAGLVPLTSKHFDI